MINRFIFNTRDFKQFKIHLESSFINNDLAFKITCQSVILSIQTFTLCVFTKQCFQIQVIKIIKFFEVILGFSFFWWWSFEDSYSPSFSLPPYELKVCFISKLKLKFSHDHIRLGPGYLNRKNTKYHKTCDLSCKSWQRLTSALHM